MFRSSMKVRPFIHDLGMDERPETDRGRAKMSERILVALRDAAKKAGITPAQAKYWVKLLGVALVMKGRVGFLDQEAADHLVKMAGLVAGGASPKQAAFEISGIVPEKDIIPVDLVDPDGVGELREKLERLEAKGGLVEKALVMLAEENRAMRQEMAKLVEVNQALQLRLEPPPLPAVFQEPPKPVKAWTPAPAKDPREGMGFLKRFWVEILHPEQLRRQVS